LSLLIDVRSHSSLLREDYVKVHHTF